MIAGWLFYSHEELNHLPSSQDTTSTSAKDYDFNDPDIALCSADPRKYWVFASDHDRDDAGGNSAHMLALYRVFSGDDQASFDSHSGVVTPLPVELFLRFGCMLVVVVQTEGAVVYVPSATNNESAHLVTTTSDRAAISVGGNVLNPRHITRLIRQHEDEGPLEAIRLEWARDFSGTSPEVAETEPYRIGSAGHAAAGADRRRYPRHAHIPLWRERRTTLATSPSTIANRGSLICSPRRRPAASSVRRSTTAILYPCRW